MNSRAKVRAKGQVEFIVIIALVIIAITAVVLVSRQAAVTPPVTSGIPEEAKTVKDSVTNLMRAGVNEKLALIYNQGGALRPSYSVGFGAFDTAVWSACGESTSPDVSKEIGSGVLSYLRENLKDEMEFFGKNVEFDFSKSKYEVDVIKDRINIRVYLPTKIEAYDLQQPYEMTVESRLYDVLDFSRNFVNDTGKSRFFEVITLASMIHSNPEHENWVPVTGIQTGCGNSLFKTRSQLLPGIKGIIDYTVSHVVWNAAPPRTAENPFYPINNVGGKQYPGLQVAFAYPPSWDSQINRYFTFSPDPLRIIPKPTVPLVPLCMAPYSVAYSFRYPVVVMVEDSVLHQWFKFAVMVDIQNTQPGECSAQLGGESEYDIICSSQAKCDARITVKNTSGSPVEGAEVGFYVCGVGATDENGVAQGKIPCMVSELSVFKQGYRTSGELLGSEEVKDRTVTLERVQDSVLVHFRGLETEALLPMASDGVYSGYSIAGPSKGITDFGKRLLVFVSFSPSSPNYYTNEDSAVMIANYDEEGNPVAELSVSGLQPVVYNVTASVIYDVDEEKSIPVGYVNTSFELAEGGTDVFIYLPVVLKTRETGGTSDIPDAGIASGEADKLTAAVIARCGKAAGGSPSNSC